MVSRACVFFMAVQGHVSTNNRRQTPQVIKYMKAVWKVVVAHTAVKDAEAGEQSRSSLEKLIAVLDDVKCAHSAVDNLLEDELQAGGQDGDVFALLFNHGGARVVSELKPLIEAATEAAHTATREISKGHEKNVKSITDSLSAAFQQKPCSSWRDGLGEEATLEEFKALAKEKLIDDNSLAGVVMTKFAELKEVR